MRQSDIDEQTQEWLAFVERVRTDPSISFAMQWAKFVELSDARDPSLGPLPTWVPSPDRIAASNVGRLLSELGFHSFGDLHRWSVEHRADFWQVATDRLGIIFDPAP